MRVFCIFFFPFLNPCGECMHATIFHFNRAPAGMGVRLAKERCTISRLLTKEDVEGYWQRFKQVFPPEEEKVWDALFVGLTKYHAILQGKGQFLGFFTCRIIFILVFQIVIN